jgi:hypothetical protein
LDGSKINTGLSWQLISRSEGGKTFIIPPHVLPGKSRTC